MRRIIARAALGLSLFLVAGMASAQSLATLKGFINDETGGRLPGSTVVVRNVDTGLERNLITDASGFYVAHRLQPGNYTLTASLTGFQTVVRENIVLLVGQIIDLDVTLGVASVEEAITVTAESPILESTRSSTQWYVTNDEIENLPIQGRDFVQFAKLTPTVKEEPGRGGISMAGQRGTNTGVAIDGSEAKSAFFGYGRGGESTENEGLVIAQDSVQEFQVTVNGFEPEYGRNGGGYLNVITKSGTNTLGGTGLFFFQNDSMVSNLLRSPLEEFRGISEDDPRFEPESFSNYKWGGSVGGPIVRDKTHFFFSYDQLSTSRDFIDNLNGKGHYDAILARFPGLVDGYTPNSNGIAAPDPVLGRTAFGNFTRSIDNLILFGKVNHQFNENQSLSVRYNFTDFDRESDLKSEESLKTENTHSLVASLISVLSNNAVNEFRFQFAKDNLDRLSNLGADDIVAEVVIEAPTFDSFGKPDFLPIFVREEKIQIQDNLSYLFGAHDLKFGVDLNLDDLSEFFAGASDGEYTYATIDAFLADQPRRSVVYFGNVQNPNFAVKQQTLGLFAQDSWRVNDRLNVNYGLRWEGTFNPGDLEHVLPEGEEIPDDLDNFGPRLGIAYQVSGDGKDVLRAGVGLFHARTPTLIFFNVYQDNGIFPNYGRATVLPGQTGYVPIGQPIENENPPAGLPIALAYMQPGFEDPETWRLNLGYERELAPNMSAYASFTYANGSKLQGSYDVNVFDPGRDPFGRPVYPAGRPDSDFSTVRVRDSFGDSDYYATSFGFTRRFAGSYSVQGHYTWSQDKDNDSNERNATAITITDFTDFDYDWGYSERDITHRIVMSAVAELPLEFMLSGIWEWRSGYHFTPLDPNTGLTAHPSQTIRARAVVTGELLDRNSDRGPDFNNVDVRINKFFDFGGARFEAILDIFNLFNNANFGLSDGAPQPFPNSQMEPVLRDGVTPNPEYGLADIEVAGGSQRRVQGGIRIQF
jgi:hypothetical protein